MAISLKNIEDRVKVLESISLNGWNSYISSLGEAYWDPVSGFGFCTGKYPAFKVGNTYTINFPKEFKNIPKVPFCQVYSHGEYGTYYENFAKNITTKGFQVTVQKGNSTNAQMDNYSGYIAFGILKLYYNFSYNIIYKILSSIKFKISQIISSLKIKKEVKIMAISMQDHENRIFMLEQVQSNTNKILKLDEPNINIKLYPKTYDIKEYPEYNAIAVSFDAWGTYFEYPHVQDTRVIPFCLLEERDIRVSMMWQPDLAGTEGLLLRKVGNRLTVKYSGIEAEGAGFWWIYLLKIYYIFRYNIYSKIIRSIISKINHFFTKICKYGGEVRDGYIC